MIDDEGDWDGAAEQAEVGQSVVLVEFFEAKTNQRMIFQSQGQSDRGTSSPPSGTKSCQVPPHISRN
jgi:hypothetical protein